MVNIRPSIQDRVSVSPGKRIGSPVISFILVVSFISFKFSGQNMVGMQELERMRRPSKNEQKVASQSYSALVSAIEQIESEDPEIEIEETNDKIKIPLSALRLLSDILKSMGEGKLISIVPMAAEVTTQAAAELLGCSRPHLVKLLEEGKIDFTKVGKHRRIKFEDVMNYKQELKRQQKENIIDIMNADEEAGLYDS